MTTVLIVAHRTEAPRRRRIWADLEVTLASLAAHGDGLGLSIVLGWEGPGAPEIPAALDVTSVELPPLLSDWEARHVLAAEHVDDELIVLLRDGAILTPDSLALLFDDAAQLADLDAPFGLIGGVRNRPAAGLAEVDRLDVDLTLIARQRLLSLAPPEDDLIGDAVVSWDLHLDGCRNFTSRSTVLLAPEVASDTVTELSPMAQARLHYHRPDLVEIVGGGQVPATPTDIEGRLALAAQLRHAGRTIEAAGAVGDVDLTELSDGQVRFVAELAWAVGDFLTATDVLGSRSALAAERTEAEELMRRGAEYGDPHVLASIEAQAEVATPSI